MLYESQEYYQQIYSYDCVCVTFQWLQIFEDKSWEMNCDVLQINFFKVSDILPTMHL